MESVKLGTLRDRRTGELRLAALQTEMVLAGLPAAFRPRRAAAATPLRPWLHSAALTVTTSIILPSLTE
jgi:hypothetical protein